MKEFNLKICYVLCFIIIVGCDKQNGDKKLYKLELPEYVNLYYRGLLNLSEAEIYGIDGATIYNYEVNIQHPNQHSYDFYSDSKGAIRTVQMRESNGIDYVVPYLSNGIDKYVGSEEIMDTIKFENLEFILEEVFKTDQAFRVGDTGENREFYNRKLVIAIFDKFNIQELGKLSTKAVKSLWVVVQHNPDMIDNYFLPLYELSLDNKIPLKLMATMADRLLLMNIKKQYYGTQYTGEGILSTLINRDDIDRIRDEVGLKPIQEYIIEIKDF